MHTHSHSRTYSHKLQTNIHTYTDTTHRRQRLTKPAISFTNQKNVTVIRNACPQVLPICLSMQGSNHPDCDPNHYTRSCMWCCRDEQCVRGLVATGVYPTTSPHPDTTTGSTYTTTTQPGSTYTTTTELDTTFLTTGPDTDDSTTAERSSTQDLVTTSAPHTTPGPSTTPAPSTTTASWSNCFATACGRNTTIGQCVQGSYICRPDQVS